MKIEIRIDPDCTEPRAIILTAAVTREVEAAVNALRRAGPAEQADPPGSLALCGRMRYYMVSLN